MKASLARELARRYAAGELSFDEYRAQRRDLIDTICAGIQTLQYGQTAPHPLNRRKPRWAILASLAIIVAAAVAVSLWAIHTRNSSVSSAPMRTAESTGPYLLRTFTDANDWSEASINHFMQQWQRLPSREQQAARNSYLFPRLVSQLQEQIVSQQAMLELAPDPEAAVQHLTHLRQMATLLGAQKLK